MRLYWPLLVVLFCLFQWTRAQNRSAATRLPLLFNGHYIKWSSSKIEEKFICEKRYIPKNIIYTRFQLCSDRVFLASPRLKRGVPFTLGYALMTNIDRCYNYVRPFPSANDQDPTKEGPSTLYNVVDLVMGQDGVLWVLDVGISETLSDRPTRENDPKVVGFDVASGKAKHTIPLRTLTCRLKSRLQFMAVEYRKDDVAVYVGDGGTRSIIVLWVGGKSEAFRVKMPVSTVLGCRESREMDVFYIALIEQCTGNYIYFTYLSSPDVFRVRTKDLQKRINPKCLVNIGRKPCRMVFVGVGYETVLYFRIKGQNHLYGWDAKTSFLEENFMLVRKSKDCRTITHVDVDNAGVLWVLESNIQDFLVGNVGCFGPNMMLSPVLDKPTPVNECSNPC